MHLIYLADAKIPSRSTNSAQVMRMCAAFQQTGVGVTLVYPHYAGPIPEGYAGDVWSHYGIRTRFCMRQVRTTLSRRPGVLPLVSPVVRMVFYSLTIQQILNQVKEPLIFYGRSALGVWLADRFRRRNRANHYPIIAMELHDFPSSRYTQDLLRRIDYTVLITHALARDITKNIPLDSGRLTIEPSGFDVASRLDPADARRYICHQLQLSPDQPIALYTGRVNKEKGAETLLATADALGKIGCQLVLCGKVYDSSYRQRIVDAGWPHVHFTGFVPPSQIPDYLQGADILLLPSTPALSYASYTSPIKLFEYMAAGKPIIASDLPVLREVVRHEHNVLLVSATDASKWVDAIRRLIDDKELARGLATQAERDVQTYSWNRRAERILKFISEQ